MPQEHIKSFLNTIGLNGNEVKLYLVALSLGTTHVAELAKKSGIHRVAVYPLVNSLIQKGLMFEVKEDNKKKIKVVGPTHLKNIIAHQKRRIRKLELNYESLLPELQALYSHSPTTPKVQYFEGIEGMRQINLDILETLPNGGITYSYAHVDNLEKAFSGYVAEREGHADSRVKQGIKNKVIMPDTSLVKKLIKTKKKRLLEMVVVPLEKFPYKNDVTIYKNKFAILSLDPEKIGVIIESKDIYEDQLAIFNLAWEGAKQFGKII